jgi:hypothetical protein
MESSAKSAQKKSTSATIPRTVLKGEYAFTEAAAPSLAVFAPRCAGFFAITTDVLG